MKSYLILFAWIGALSAQALPSADEPLARATAMLVELDGAGHELPSPGRFALTEYVNDGSHAPSYFVFCEEKPQSTPRASCGSRGVCSTFAVAPSKETSRCGNTKYVAVETGSYCGRRLVINDRSNRCGHLDAEDFDRAVYAWDVQLTDGTGRTRSFGGNPRPVR